MAIKTLTQKNLTWVNIDEVNEEALQYLRDNHNFHELDFEDLQEDLQTPKIDTYKNYLFIVLQFPQWRGTDDTVVPREVDIFIGDGYLITIQHTKSKALKNFFYRCMKKSSIKKEWMSGSSGYLLYQLIEALYHESQPVLNRMGKQLSMLEDEIFESGADGELVKQLGMHRRNTLNFRRILDPQRYLIATLSHTRRPFLDESMSIYFDDITDYLNKLWAIVTSYKDSIDGLHVTVESLINQRTNKVISSLTVISVGLLPLTLLSGLYGMNVAALPFADDPIWVWGIFGGLVGLILISIAVMKKKRWI